MPRGSGIDEGLEILGREGCRRDCLIRQAAQHRFHILCIRFCSLVQYSQCTAHSTSQGLGVQLKVHHMVEVQLEVSKREEPCANLAFRRSQVYPDKTVSVGNIRTRLDL